MDRLREHGLAGRSATAAAAAAAEQILRIRHVVRVKIHILIGGQRIRQYELIHHAPLMA